MEIDQYIEEHQYDIGTLVAFSGEVDDKDLALGAVTESSRLLNPKLQGRGIRDAFNTDEYRIPLVAPINFKWDSTRIFYAACT